MSDPNRTIFLLDELKKLGFWDVHFVQVHHKIKESILGHRNYCQQVASFQKAKNNDLVQKRLELIYESFPNVDALNRPKVLSRLINESVHKYPLEKPMVVVDEKLLDANVPRKAGLYIVELYNEIPLLVAEDKRYVRECARVNKDNIKVGKAKCLSGRQLNYWKTFGNENVAFQSIVEVDLAVLSAAESAVLGALSDYRLRGPKGRLLEWLQNVDADTVLSLVKDALETNKLPHRILF